AAFQRNDVIHDIARSALREAGPVHEVGPSLLVPLDAAVLVPLARRASVLRPRGRTGRLGRRGAAFRLRGAPVVGIHVGPVLLGVALDMDGLAGRAVLALGALGPFAALAALAALAGMRRVRGTVRRAVAACEYGAAPTQPDDGRQG